uniref:Putative secreted protein n=1 Tax=Anopheles triannulatus TaxID=58253 RepID=A0A2M4B5A4_9DIPT
MLRLLYYLCLVTGNRSEQELNLTNVPCVRKPLPSTRTWSNIRCFTAPIDHFLPFSLSFDPCRFLPFPCDDDAVADGDAFRNQTVQMSHLRQSVCPASQYG